MNRKRQKQIEELATQVLMETGCYRTPVDVNLIAAKKGVNISPYDFGEDVTGVLILEGDKATIGVNKNNNNNDQRRRFTIAHELGHFILQHQRSGVFVDTPTQYFTILYRDSKSSTGEHLQEREANAFAAALLMPEKLVMNYLNNTKFDFKKDDIIQLLAKEFDVNPQAMSFRLSNLGLVW
ncbi:MULTISPECIES: ImmA/IrrE family metallo-endopeptidase [unclassified Spirosoma]|uniref:ImmA/IrrE family metallo-endopeptidase n=1 Tax=unclassified Spirosoma TaxID=2621999 RepID=UPI000968CF5C|nr:MULTISPECIES: ImmA/IrrE family metallo-endopeptidase [unclassified Spirosoma]OJW71572.1 MAG: hypothetical protein BGO59_26715 [Spirosoma sp. 48-14]